MSTISFNDITDLLNNIYMYTQTKDDTFINSEEKQKLINQLKNIDYSIKTYEEYNTKTDFIESSHGPARIAMFLLNYFGEQALNNSELTIKKDDPSNFTTSHTNTYILKLKDEDSHKYLTEGNPTVEDLPFDFYTEFVKQMTSYPTKTVDTTKTAWDSFNRGYTTPHRSLDFKSSFWTSGQHSHNVDYIIKFTADKKVKVYLNTQTPIEKEINLKISDLSKVYVEKYYQLLNMFSVFEPLIWNNLLLSNN